MTIQEALAQLLNGQPLSRDETRLVMGTIITTIGTTAKAEARGRALPKLATARKWPIRDRRLTARNPTQPAGGGARANGVC